MGRTRMLTEQQREKARLMKANGMKYREIADYFRVHPDTIRYQIKPWYTKVADRVGVAALTPFEKGVWLMLPRSVREKHEHEAKRIVQMTIDRAKKDADLAKVLQLPDGGKAGTSPD
jgi:IS30 family transposase